MIRVENCELNIEEVVLDYQGIELSFDTIEMINETGFIEKNNFSTKLNKFIFEKNNFATIK